MKIRSKLELKDLLDKDFAWRVQELTYVRNQVKTSEGKALPVSIRSAILLLYAHWEGFIKNAGTYYVNYVKNQKLPYKNLITCFVALSAKQKISIFENTNKATIHNQFVEFLKSCDDEIARIEDLNVIKTGSNLNSLILKELLATIGVDFSPFELKSNLIDEQLLNYRNTIAHGEFLQIQQKDYRNLHDEVFKMMVLIKTEIENAVALDSFKIP